MPRPKKFRRVCSLPQVKSFVPSETSGMSETVQMSVEEYEVIRLMDFEDFSQDESAERMGVARSTVQRIYDVARKKIADCIVNGKSLKIEGGNYRLCSGEEEKEMCGCRKCCRRHRFCMNDNNSKENN